MIEIGSAFKKKTIIASDILLEFDAAENQAACGGEYAAADKYYASLSIMGSCRQRKSGDVSAFKTNRIHYVSNKQIKEIKNMLLVA